MSYHLHRHPHHRMVGIITTFTLSALRAIQTRSPMWWDLMQVFADKPMMNIVIPWDQ